MTESQKTDIINNIIKPASVLTITPEIVEVNYTYLILNCRVLFNAKQTRLTASQIESLVTQGIKNYCNANLNTFNSTFVVGNLIQYIQSLNSSIIAVDFDLSLQKRFVPTFNTTNSYKINFGNELLFGTGRELVSISPSFSQFDTVGNYYPEVLFEQSPIIPTFITSLQLVSGGSGYTNPTVSIVGDGTGATATATVSEGVVTGITLTSAGTGFSQAIVNITDDTGTGAFATATVVSNMVQLRTFYFNNGIKNILTGPTTSSNTSTTSAGSVDFTNGIVDITSFTPTSLNSTDGQLRITAFAANRIVSSSFDNIITLDNNDAAAITVKVTTQ